MFQKSSLSSTLSSCCLFFFLLQHKCTQIGHVSLNLETFFYYLSLCTVCSSVMSVYSFFKVNHFLKPSFPFFVLFLSVRLLLVLRGHSFFPSPPQWPMTSDFKGFLSQIVSITFLSSLYSSERASISLFNV